MKKRDGEAQREMRRKRVAANLLGGLTYRQMAEALEVSLGTIASDVRIIIGRWRTDQVGTTDEWAQIQIRRLDTMLNALWDKALSGDEKAVRAVVEIIEKQNKILGTEAPTKHELGGPDGGPVVHEHKGQTHGDVDHLAAVLATLVGVGAVALPDATAGVDATDDELHPA